MLKANLKRIVSVVFFVWFVYIYYDENNGKYKKKGK